MKGPRATAESAQSQRGIIHLLLPPPRHRHHSQLTGLREALKETSRDAWPALRASLPAHGDQGVPWHPLLVPARSRQHLRSAAGCGSAQQGRNATSATQSRLRKGSGNATRRRGGKKTLKLARSVSQAKGEGMKSGSGARSNTQVNRKRSADFGSALQHFSSL